MSKKEFFNKTALMVALSVSAILTLLGLIAAYYEHGSIIEPGVWLFFFVALLLIVFAMLMLSLKFTALYPA